MSLTYDQLVAALSYDPETGVFTWKERPVREGFYRTDKSWNGRYAGKPAGSEITRPNTKYLQISIGGKFYLGNRLAWLYMTGEWPKEIVDHVDRDGLNNKWANLREATTSQNAANSKVPVTNTTGLKGASLIKKNGRYRSEIVHEGESIHLGCFGTADEAHAAYMRAAKSLHGEYARAS